MCTLLTRLKRHLFEILWHPDLHHANRLQLFFTIMFFHPVVEAGTETATSSRIPTALFHTLFEIRRTTSNQQNTDTYQTHQNCKRPLNTPSEFIL